MDCASCATTIESAVATVDGAVDRDTRPATGRVTVTHDPAVTSVGAVVAVIEDPGYAVEDTDGDAASSPHDVWRSPRALKAVVGAVFLAVGLVLEKTRRATTRPRR